MRVPRGGKRQGAGRPPLDPTGEPRKRRVFMLTNDEFVFLTEALEYRRQQEKNLRGDKN
jgi:hypothetical protein